MSQIPKRFLTCSLAATILQILVESVTGTYRSVGISVECSLAAAILQILVESVTCEKLTDASPINDWDISSAKKDYFKQMFFDCPTHPEFSKITGTWDEESGTFTPAA